MTPENVRPNQIFGINIRKKKKGMRSKKQTRSRKHELRVPAPALQVPFQLSKNCGSAANYLLYRKFECGKVWRKWCDRECHCDSFAGFV
jgi:hypothetical protein